MEKIDCVVIGAGDHHWNLRFNGTAHYAKLPYRRFTTTPGSQQFEFQVLAHRRQQSV